VSTLVTGEAVELSVQPAALAARALSCIIDYVVYTLVDIGLLIAMFWLLIKTAGLNSLLLGSIMTVMSISVFVLLPMIVEVLSHGRSLGKLILGLRIVRDDGGAVRIRHSFIRALLWPFEILSTGGGIAALSGLISPQAKRLGDYLAGTMAVSERSATPRHRIPVAAGDRARHRAQPVCRPRPAGGDLSRTVPVRGHPPAAGSGGREAAEALDQGRELPVRSRRPAPRSAAARPLTQRSERGRC
jgi:uncharacterized RDD family membrane protein YckC